MNSIIRTIEIKILSPVLIDSQGGGVTLIFSYIHMLRSFFWVQNFEFQYFLGFSEKINIFLSMKILWTFFGGHHKIGLYLEVISMHFRVFS